MRAVNYILDDEEAFKKFLHDGRIEMHNNAVESVFRHILKTRYAHISEQVRAAMGRRCWLNSGSHDAATNIAFMYSLYESCKMNDIDFGEYVEDILTRMMNGDDDYRSMIPCYYTPGKKQEKRSLDTIKWRKVQSDKIFQKIMLAVMPVKSGLRSYGGLPSELTEHAPI